MFGSRQMTSSADILDSLYCSRITSIGAGRDWRKSFNLAVDLSSSPEIVRERQACFRCLTIYCWSSFSPLLPLALQA
ncbi:hypothetical protein SCA6_019234 [Theobroma cacao]